MSCPFARQQQKHPSFSYGSQQSYSSYQHQQPQASYASFQNQGSYSYVQQQQQQSSQFHSQVEQALRNAQQPIHFPQATQVRQVGQYSGLHLNQNEEQQFRGSIPLSQYQINQDPNPEVIRKQLGSVKVEQQIAVKYLNPPPAPKPGDLIIRERANQAPQAPPVILRRMFKYAFSSRLT
jgi:hypothetical protein